MFSQEFHLKIERIYSLMNMNVITFMMAIRKRKLTHKLLKILIKFHTISEPNWILDEDAGYLYIIKCLLLKYQMIFSQVLENILGAFS